MAFRPGLRPSCRRGSRCPSGAWACHRRASGPPMTVVGSCGSRYSVRTPRGRKVQLHSLTTCAATFTTRRRGMHRPPSRPCSTRRSASSTPPLVRHSAWIILRHYRHPLRCPCHHLSLSLRCRRRHCHRRHTHLSRRPLELHHRSLVRDVCVCACATHSAPEMVGRGAVSH